MMIMMMMITIITLLLLIILILCYAAAESHHAPARLVAFRVKWFYTGWRPETADDNNEDNNSNSKLIANVKCILSSSDNSYNGSYIYIILVVLYVL